MLAHLPEVGKGSGNPAPKLADWWKSAVWLGSSDLSDEHLVRTDEEVVYAPSVRRLAEHSLSEGNVRAVVETPRKPKSMGVMTAAKRFEAAGKRVIQTRWVEKDGCVKSRLVLQDFNRDQRRTQPEMFAPTPSTVSQNTMLAESSCDRNNHPERDYIATTIDIHTAFLHADIDQELFAEPPEESELWLETAQKRCMIITKHRNCGNSFGKSELASTVDRPELFQK